MKKLLLMTIAAAAITFTGCGNKNAQPAAEAAADSTSADSTAKASALSAIKAGDAAAAPATAEALAKELDKTVASKDSKNFTVLLSNVKAKIAQLAKDNPGAGKDLRPAAAEIS